MLRRFPRRGRHVPTGAQRQPVPLLRVDRLESGVVARGVGVELVDITQALIERALERERGKASGTDRLIAVELNLVRLILPARAYEVNAQIASRRGLLLQSKIELVVVRSLQGSTGEGIETHGQRAGRGARLNSGTRCGARAKD